MSKGKIKEGKHYIALGIGLSRNRLHFTCLYTVNKTVWAWFSHALHTQIKGRGIMYQN